MKILQNLPQVIVRGSRFAWGIVGGLGEYIFKLVPSGRHRDQLELAKWCQRVSHRLLASLNITLGQAGAPPSAGMVASNHLSYLDIIVLAAIAPSTFVSKYEVKYWPIFGWFGTLAGTLFLRRERKAHAVEVSQQFSSVINSGALLTLFPEGTSTDGRTVKPFHSTLFQQVAKQDWKVTPAWLHYQMSLGSVEREVCFVDDMLFVPHFLNLLACDRIEAHVVFGHAAPTGLNRKELARYLHNQVCRLAAEHSGCERFSNPQVEWDESNLTAPVVSPG